MAADAATGTLSTAVALLDPFVASVAATSYSHQAQAIVAAWDNVRRALEPAPLPPPPIAGGDVAARAAELLAKAQAELAPMVSAQADPVGVAVVTGTTLLALASLAVEGLAKVAAAVRGMDETMMAAHGVSDRKDPPAPADAPPAGYLEEVLAIAKSNDGPSSRGLRLAAVRERYQVGAGVGGG